MKCDKCRTEMLVEYEYNKGRHIKRRYVCPKCKSIKIKNIKTLFPRKW